MGGQLYGLVMGGTTIGEGGRGHATPPPFLILVFLVFIASLC